MTPDHEHGAEQFIGHDAPARATRADGFVYAELSDVGETPIRWEQLPSRSCDVVAGTFEICCIPFFAYGLALGDIVETRPLEAHGHVDRVVGRVVEPSAHRTFRVQFLHAPSSIDATAQLLAALARLGCLVETWSPRMIAIDAQPETAADVQEILEIGMHQDGYEYELGSPGDSA